MNLLSIESITKNYSEKQLLQDISFGIHEGDKIGVIGVNGTGKSTLLKIIAGIENPDGGRIVKGSQVQIEYLSQDPYFDMEAVVLEQVFRGHSPVMKAIREYERALQAPDSSSEKIIQLTQKMDALNAWSIESEAKAVLTRLGITDFEARVGTLSGGQRKRVALAAALVNPSELLILDEPTNHLDHETIDWLEQYLNNRKGALLMVTHDRYFLDRVVNEIVELDRGRLYIYKGNYDTFLEKKLEREDMEAAQERKRQGLLKKELAWIRRGAKARSTKQKARIERFEELQDRGVELQDERLSISAASSRLGRKVIEMEHIHKSYGALTVIEDFSYTVLRNDRVGVIGPNGSGKSTLINIISGKLQPDSGRLEVGDTVKIGVFSQETYHMDEEMRVIEYAREGAEYAVNGEGERITASQMLERFLFPPEMQWSLISKLSGGEKRRLYLLRVLMEAPNVLLLDEPTNDLDIETLTILEDYLEGFPGAVMAVSHDRYFLDKVADKLFVFEGDGRIAQHTGNYTELKEAWKKEDRPTRDPEKDSGKERNRQPRERALKFSYKEQKEYDEIEGTISELEEKIQETEGKMAAAAANFTLLQELLADKEGLSRQLEERMERWVYLSELAEKIENQE